MSALVLLELPSDEEITVIQEKQVVEHPRSTLRTIRYRSGFTVLLWLDSQNRITRLEIICEEFPLLFVGNQIVKP